MNSIGAFQQGDGNSIGAFQNITAGAVVFDAINNLDAMPRDLSKIHAFIAASGITITGCLVNDYRDALFASLTTPNNPSNHDYNVADAFKEWWEQENP